MNIRPIIKSPLIPLPADAQRRLWTADELLRLDEAGILHPEERVELIAGEIFTLAPKGARHEVLRNELILFWARRLPHDLKFAEEPSLRLDDHYEPQPDIMLFPATQRVHEVTGGSVLLVVEIADTSLRWDVGPKSLSYSMFGVREYWVINARTFETIIHLGPGMNGYSDVRKHPASDLLTPSAVALLAVRIGDLPIGTIDET